MPRRSSRKLLQSRRTKILAALFGLAAGIGLFLAGTQLPATQKPAPITQTEEAPLPPEPKPTYTGTDLQTLLAQTDTALETAPVTPSQPATPAPVPAGSPNWIKNATPVSATGPVLAIVIDDMGEDEVQSKKALQTLPYTVTMAFLPYPRATPFMAKQARAAGHELLIHFPMQPKGELKQQLSPKTTMLLNTDTQEELTAKIEKNLAVLSPIVIGINNHMGSAFTQNEPGMTLLLNELNTRRLMFLDSLTIAPTATPKAKAAAGATIPVLTRNVFLDDVQTEEEVQRQLNRAIAHAHKHGKAIAIGHPHQETLNVLSRNLDAITAAGVTLVPLTHLIP